MDEPGGSYSRPRCPEGRAVLDRGVPVRDVVRGARGAVDGSGRADRDVGDDVRRLRQFAAASILSDADPRGGGDRGGPLERPVRPDRGERGPVPHGLAMVAAAQGPARRGRDLGAVGRRARRPRPEDHRRRGGRLYAAWVAGTTAGVLFGDLIGDPARWGLDAAFPRCSWRCSCPTWTVRTRRPPRSWAPRSGSP